MTIELNNALELEEIAESAFQRFDAERKHTGDEKAAFKRQVRGVVLASVRGAEKASQEFVQQLLDATK